MSEAPDANTIHTSEPEWAERTLEAYLRQQPFELRVDQGTPPSTHELRSFERFRAYIKRQRGLDAAGVRRLTDRALDAAGLRTSSFLTALSGSDRTTELIRAPWEVEQPRYDLFRCRPSGVD